MRDDETFMRAAIRLSEAAVARGDEPFGAVLVKDGEIVFENGNHIHTRHDPTEHAEIGLLRAFMRETGCTDLSGCTLYSSCEPCFMCSGAMVWAKLGRLVYAASDVDLCDLLGVQGSPCARLVFEHSGLEIPVTSGVLREESLEVLKGYFANHEKH